MEGVSIFYPDEWGAAGLDATEYAAKDLKRCLEGLACHLFGKTTLVFLWVHPTNSSYLMNIFRISMKEEIIVSIIFLDSNRQLAEKYEK